MVVRWGDSTLDRPFHVVLVRPVCLGHDTFFWWIKTCNWSLCQAPTFFCCLFFFSKTVNKSFRSDWIKNGPCSFAAEVFQLILRLHYKLYQSIVHSCWDLGQIYAPEKILFLHDLDKKMCLNSVTQPNLYETGILPPGVSGLLCETCLVCD